MAITYDKIAYDQVELELKAILATEFPNVYIGNTFSMKGSECIRIDLVSSTSIEQSTFYEQRLYALNLRYYFKNDTSQERINKAVKGKIDRLRKHLLDYQVNGTKGWAALIIEDINYNVKDEENEEDDNLHIAEFNITIQHHNVLQVSAFSNLSISFDGGDEYLDAGSSSTLVGNSAMTISAWIKVDWSNHPDYSRIVDKNFTSFRLGIDKDAVVKSIFFFVNGQFAKSTANALNSDNWQHVVGVFDKSLHSTSTSIRIYVNGNEVTYGTQQSTGSDITSTSDNLHIGADIGVSNHFAGNIDEVSLWHSALDSDTIKAIYNSGRPNNLQIGEFTHLARTHLKGYWRMGDGTLDSFPLIADQTDTSFGTDIFVSTGRTAMALGTSVDKDDGSAGWVVGGTLTTESGGFLKLVSGGSTTRIYDQLSGISGKVLKVSLDYRSNKPIGFSTDYFTPLVFFDKTSDNTGTDLLADNFTSISFFVRAKTSGSNFWGQLRLLGTHQNIASTPSVGDELHVKNIKTSILNGNPALMTNNQASDIEEDTP